MQGFGPVVIGAANGNAKIGTLGRITGKGDDLGSAGLEKAGDDETAKLILRGRTMRFSELRREVEGVSERMLSETLKRLETNGLVRRVAYPVVPPVTEYSLTDLGQGGADRVAALAEWVETNLPAILETRPAAEGGS